MRAFSGGSLVALLCVACVSPQNGSDEASAPPLCKTVTACKTAGTYDPLCYSDNNTLCDSSNCPLMAATCGTAIETVPLAMGGCPMADYYGNITVGNQNFLVIMDSGSTTLALAGSGCVNCTGITPLYQPSSSATNLNVQTTSTYGDGSFWDGNVYSDQVVVGGIAPITVKLASIGNENGFFGPEGCDANYTTNYVQGILGLGGFANAVSGTDSYISNMAAATHGPAAFSVALCDDTGNLWLGGYDSNSISAPMQFTPLITAGFGSTYYGANFRDMQVNGHSLGYTSKDYGAVIIDTGTSAITLPYGILLDFADKIQGDTSFQAAFNPTMLQDGNCLPANGTLTRAELDATLPTVTFTFPGKNNPEFSITLPATYSYLAYFNDGTSTPYYCPLVGPSPGDNLVIFGNAMMRKHVLVFDGTNNVVGFAPRATGVCPTSG